jgi:8-oxo-dGTP pyrophosphatase MutT (NUDIX family)
VLLLELFKPWPQDHTARDAPFDQHAQQRQKTPDLPDTIGPHQHREMTLMRAGRKPMALINDSDMPNWKDAIAENGWLVRSIPHRAGFLSYVVALPGEEARLNQITKIYARANASERLSIPDHMKIGRLLGYTKPEIAAFLKRSLGHDARVNESEYDDQKDHFDALDRTGFFGAAGAGCIFIARSTGRILLNHRSVAVEQPHTWGVWGGAINRGEDPATAVRREVREEAGYHGDYDLIPLYVFQKETFRYSNFLVEVDDEFTPHLDWESQGYEWCEWGHWPSPMHFGLKALLNDPASVRRITDAIKSSQEVDESAISPISSITNTDRFQVMPKGANYEAYITGMNWIRDNKNAPNAVRHVECPFPVGDPNRMWWFKGASGA